MKSGNPLFFNPNLGSTCASKTGFKFVTDAEEGVAIGARGRAGEHSVRGALIRNLVFSSRRMRA